MPEINANNLEQFMEDLEQQTASLPQRLEANPDNAANGLVKLVLTLVDILRDLLEKQAMRRIENDTLSEEEVERLGQTFMALSERMEELKAHFNLTDEDLKLNLNINQDFFE